MTRPGDRYTGLVLRRQVEMLFERKRPVIFVFPVLGWLFAALLRGPGVSDAAIGWWFAALCANTVAGLWLHEAFRRRGPRESDPLRWSRWALVNSALNGLSFGLAGLFLFPPRSGPAGVPACPDRGHQLDRDRLQRVGPPGLPPVPGLRDRARGRAVRAGAG